MGEPKSLCILGRQPALGLAELESFYGAEHVRPLEGAALLDIPAEDIDFKRLGGTIKTARLLTPLPYSEWQRVIKYLANKIPEHLSHAPEGKFTLGLSVYGLNVSVSEINKAALSLKKIIKNAGRPARVVPNKAPALNSAQVLHNKLTHKGAWELLLVADGRQTLLAQTLFVQDINAYAARDQARPKRDPRVGMLPPKLAQTILNLAFGQITQSSPPSPLRVLDPFCGTGVILQEALLMGCHVLGTDIEPRMVEYAKANIQWLIGKYPVVEGQVSIEAADATSHKWPGFTAVASEVYLGRPLGAIPDEAKLKQIIADTNTVIAKFLKNLAPQLKSGQRLCLAVPAWRRTDGRFIHVPLIDDLTDMSYNRFSFSLAKNDDLIYIREGQIVGRELLVLTKS